MLRRTFDLLAILSFLLFVCLVSLWVRQLAPSQQPDRALGDQADRVLPLIRLSGPALSDVIDFMRDVSGANIDVNWAAAQAAGIRRDKPVWLQLNNVRFSEAFAQIVGSAGLAYTVDHSTLCVSTRQDLKRIGTADRPAWPWPTDEDIRAKTSLHESLASDRTTLQSCLEKISGGRHVPMVVWWDELRRTGVRPDTAIDFDGGEPRTAWLDDVLRQASVQHTIQYQLRDGVLVVAPSEWFDRQEKPLKRGALAVATMVVVGWVVALARVRRRPRARRGFALCTVAALACCAGIHIWKLRTTELHADAFDRRFSFGDFGLGSFRLSIQPVALPWGSSWRVTAVTGPQVLFSRCGLRLVRTGELHSELRATAPCAAVGGVFLVFPAAWVMIELRRKVRRLRRVQAGKCLVCGYDLRESIARCPECGCVFAGT